MTKFKITVERVTREKATVEVVAENDLDACDIAEDAASFTGEIDDVDISVLDCEELYPVVAIAKPTV